MQTIVKVKSGKEESRENVGRTLFTLNGGKGEKE